MNVELKIDGKNIPLNEYVTKVFSSVILGLIDTLHAIPEDWETLQIEVNKKK